MNKDLIVKALNVSGEGSDVVQQEIDKTIAMLLNYKNPLRVNLPRKPGSGPGYYCVRRSPVAAGSRAEWVSDTDTITEQTGSYTQVSFPYKTIATKGKVTRKLQAIGKSYVDILAEEIEAKIAEFKAAEEDAYINGNFPTANSKEVTGLIKQIKDAGQIVTTGSVDGGTSLTLSKMDELIDKCKGEPDAIIMSKKGRRILQTLLQTYQRWIDRVEVDGGFKLLSYNGIPIFVSDGVRDDYYFDGSDLVGTTTVADSQSTIAIAVNFTECFVSELTPVTFKMLAQTTTQYDEFEIYSDQALVVRDYLTAAMLVGIKE